MAHKSAQIAFAALTVTVIVSSCGLLCDRSGCDAFNRLSAPSSITTGIVGVVALRTDTVSARGCGLDCGYSTTTLGIWRTPTPIVDEPAAQAVVAAKPPDVTLQANRHYEQALAPGDYLVCGAGTCVPLTIGPNEVFTVNFLLQMAMTRTNVWAAPGGQALLVDQFMVAWR